ncbi:hypothetical protein PIROE2DRAFT_1336 [Piromyces sp. E2]|nr:hypothetical protein PIROE2DRAFT_1336 [Piromyces sp. E2]|eukprot:OUM70472.1 hypothetical protein PIROE2DRAFT_1336 [Piromyces sp. E2]
MILLSTLEDCLIENIASQKLRNYFYSKISKDYICVGIISVKSCGKNKKNIHLRTLSYGEILGNRPTYMVRLFKSDFSDQIKGYDKRKVVEIAFTGGYPEPWTLQSIRYRNSWFNDDIDTLISKNLRDISNIKRASVLKELVKILAAWSSKKDELKGNNENFVLI